MPDLAGFLEAICADPEDVGLRLIYADWLEEHGEEARAEFIRVQCELATGDFRCTCTCEYEHGIGCPASREVTLRRRERELLPRMWERRTENFWGAWEVQEAACGNSRQRPIYGVLHRGFIEAVSCTCADWLQHGPAIVRCQPVCEVKLTDREPHEYLGYFAWFDDRRQHGINTGACYLQKGIYDLLNWSFDQVSNPPVPSLTSLSSALQVLAQAALRWARGPHPERGLTALPPLEE